MKILPEKLPEKGFAKAEAITINKLIDYVKTLSPLPSADTEVDRTEHGFRIRSRGRGDDDGTGNVPRWG